MHAFDGRTDRQTDRIPIAIPRLHSMQRGKNGRPPHWNSVSGFDFDVCSHRRVILHLSSKFRRNRTIVGGVMTSYRFFKMADIVGNVLPGSGLVTVSKKVEVYLYARFRRDISVHG